MSNPGWERQTTPEEGQPHGWIQWKGSSVCMDIHCSCGARSHVDGDFVYYVRCPACGATFMVNGHIELVGLTDGEVEQVERESPGVVHVGEE